MEEDQLDQQEVASAPTRGGHASTDYPSGIHGPDGRIRKSLSCRTLETSGNQHDTGAVRYEISLNTLASNGHGENRMNETRMLAIIDRDANIGDH